MVALTVALLLLPLMAVTGLALDASRAYLVRARLGTAADSAALAGARASSEETITSEAERLFDANYPSDYLGSTGGAIKVASDLLTGRVTVTATASLPTMLMRVVGLDRIALDVTATAQRDRTETELALVLDVSNSMNAGTKLDTLRHSVRDLLDIVYGPSDEVDGLSVAVVPFTSRVSVGSSHTDWLHWTMKSWNGCVEGRDVNYLNDAPPTVELFDPTPATGTTGTGPSAQTLVRVCPVTTMPLTRRRASLDATVKSFVAGGRTRLDHGARWGWRVLSPRWDGIWGSKGSPRPYGDGLRKIVVFMSDGTNSASPYFDEMGDAEADTTFATICASMKKAGITIYTIGFESDKAGQALLTGCASSDGHYYSAAAESDLRPTFRKIAHRVATVRLTE